MLELSTTIDDKEYALNLLNCKGEGLMKKLWICLAFLVVVLGIIEIVLYPPHPRSWSKLRRGMTRSEVLAMLDLSNLEVVNRDLTVPIGSPSETWAKNYWAGRWTIRCMYNREDEIDRLWIVTVKYESYVFPRFFRMRHYD